MKLNAVGYWWDPEDPECSFPDPRDLVDQKWHGGERQKIAAYLASGDVFARYLGYSYCRFEGGPEPKEMGSRDFTDGVFVWPEGLSIYISRYGVVLPEAFVDHIKANDFQVPEIPRFIPSRLARVLKTPKGQSAEVDYRYWIDWSSDYIRRTNGK